MTAAEELRFHLCKPERATALLDELGRALPASRHELVAPGRIASGIREPAPGLALAFAAQVLPGCTPVDGRSVNALAAATGERLSNGLASHAGAWRLHAFALEGASPGRARLVAEALDDWLQKKQRRLRRTRNADFEGAWNAGETLVQLALEGTERAWLSVALPSTRYALRHVLSTFAQGRCAVARDTRPPSRAYQKLREAELRLHRPIAADETVVDLGASPGGWSFVALDRGARVTAVDRSPLREDLMRNPRLKFVKGDAFAFEPEARVDWLVCDLIAFPERTLELVERWLGRNWCARFVVTIKFRGSEDYPRVDAMKALLAKHADEFQLRSLDANKNEVTAFGETRAGRGGRSTTRSS